MADKGFFERLLETGEDLMDAFQGEQKPESIAQETADWAEKKAQELYATRADDDFRSSMYDTIVEAYRKGGENALKLKNSRASD